MQEGAGFSDIFGKIWRFCRRRTGWFFPFLFFSWDLQKTVESPLKMV